MARSFLAPFAFFALFAALSGCNGGSGADFYESCAAEGDCIEAAGCFEIAWGTGRGGMCTEECAVSDDCPDLGRMGSSCWELDGDPMVGQRVCYQRCASAADCATGFLCADAEIDGTIVDSICLPR
jgi:hypothetical protein